MKGLRHAWCCVAILTLAQVLGGEQRPESQSDIQKGVARGVAIRTQAKFVPAVPQQHALVMKTGGVRCGHAMVTIEDAKGEGGAVYKLTECFKAAMAGDGQSAVFDYSGSFLLAADLGVMSGQLRTSSNLANKNDGKHQNVVLSAVLAVKDDTLNWKISEQKEGAKDATVRASKELPLRGIRPMPKNALFGLAVFVSGAAKDGWQPDPKDGYCVPTLDPGWELDELSIEPAWVTFDAPGPQEPKGTAARMHVRLLVGELTEKGLEIEPPAPPVWQAQQVWALDARCRPLAHPAPDDPSIVVENVDPGTVDPNAPLDLEKISAALKAAETK